MVTSRAAAPGPDARAVDACPPTSLGSAEHTGGVVGADDHDLYRHGLARAIDSCSDLRVILRASRIEGLSLIVRVDRRSQLSPGELALLNGVEVCRQHHPVSAPRRDRLVLLSASGGGSVRKRSGGGSVVRAR
jgi:hypothetical protein